MSIYVDESIHDRANFIVIAAVAAGDQIQRDVENALIECGFDPGQDEFKSSMRMVDNPAARRLRDHLQSILIDCKVAIAVCSIVERDQIASLTGRLISAIDPSKLELPAKVFFDQGMKPIVPELPAGITTVHGCNSKKIAGIQVADCAAYLVSMIILSELGIVTKTVPANTVYPGDDGEIELAWTLWASFRYALSSGEPVGGYDQVGWCEPMMRPFGLLISDTCSKEVRQAVVSRFSEIWVGCIH